MAVKNISHAFPQTQIERTLDKGNKAQNKARVSVGEGPPASFGVTQPPTIAIEKAKIVDMHTFLRFLSDASFRETHEAFSLQPHQKQLIEMANDEDIRKKIDSLIDFESDMKAGKPIDQAMLKKESDALTAELMVKYPDALKALDVFADEFKSNLNKPVDPISIAVVEIMVIAQAGIAINVLVVVAGVTGHDRFERSLN